MEPLYKKGPLEYFSHLFGHEGENSLFSLLQDEGLAQSLTSGFHDEMRRFSVFTLNIGLTKKGLEKYLDVCEYVFQYL